MTYVYKDISQQIYVLFNELTQLTLTNLPKLSEFLIGKENTHGVDLAELRRVRQGTAVCTCHEHLPLAMKAWGRLLFGFRDGSCSNLLS